MKSSIASNCALVARRKLPAKRERQLKEIHARRIKKRSLTFGGLIVNRQCLLKVRVSSPPGVTPHKSKILTAIIDTGATSSSIRAELAKDLCLPVISTAKVATASSGTEPVVCDVMASVMTVESDGEKASQFRPVTVQDMSCDLLFGMDALAGGILTVDSVKGRWSWKLTKVTRMKKLAKVG